jgi:uncharacterized membrane protein YkoI
MSTACRLALAAVLLAMAGPALADAPACLGKKERRAVIASGEVITLKAALATLPENSGEVVRASLCKGPKGYVYLLTLLPRDGKVSRVTVDAKSGIVLSGP